MGEEKKLIRYIKDQQDGELRQVTSQVKSDYKRAKQQLKQVSQPTLQYCKLHTQYIHNLSRKKQSKSIHYFNTSKKIYFDKKLKLGKAIVT